MPRPLGAPNAPPPRTQRDPARMVLLDQDAAHTTIDREAQSIADEMGQMVRRLVRIASASGQAHRARLEVAAILDSEDGLDPAPGVPIALAPPLDVGSLRHLRAA